MSQATTQAQLKILVEFVGNHIILAQNNLQNTSEGRERKRKLWVTLTNELNKNGPPYKDIKNWKKVWTDYKYNTKRKLVRNKRLLIEAEEGMPFKQMPMSELEEKVIAAAAWESISIDTVVENIDDNVKSESNINDSIFDLDNQQADSNVSLEYHEGIYEAGGSTSRNNMVSSNYERRKKRNLKEEKLRIAREEIEIRKNFYQGLVNVLDERNKIELKKLELKEKFKRDKVQLQRREMKSRRTELEIIKTFITLSSSKK